MTSITCRGTVYKLKPKVILTPAVYIVMLENVFLQKDILLLSFQAF